MGLSSSSDSEQGRDLLPHNETERLRAVQRCEILDTPPDGAIDRITALAARVFQVPTAVVSIVDSDRIWFKSRYGLDLPQIPRDPGAGASAIFERAPWVVTDALLDPGTRVHPLVTGEFGLRFYAAAPLTTMDGYKVGTLSVIDRHPRKISDTKIAVLQDLASMTMNEIELRVSLKHAWELDDALLEQMLKAKQQAEHAAKHDALTGLGNRRKFDEAYSVEINRMQRHGGKLCIMMADIDHFKKINDRYGHGVGDEVLVQFGELLCLLVRPTDLVARIGGEEFVVLMPHTEVSKAVATAERLRTSLAGRHVGPLKEPVTVSIGVAELEEGEDRESLLRRADQALYHAKDTGRNKVAAANPLGTITSSSHHRHDPGQTSTE
jgi:diguanylate cyclase (GGDEF)-like protein